MIRAIDRKLLRDLWRLRAQLSTVTLLIACGVGLLISEWSSWISLRNARDSFESQYRFAELFSEVKRAPRTLEQSLRSFAGVSEVELRILLDGLVDLPHRAEPAVGHFISIPSGRQPNLNQIHLKSGRLPSEGIEHEVLVHEAFAKANQLKEGDHLSVLIQGRRETWVISGIGISPEYVYAISPFMAMPDDVHFGVFWLPEKTLERVGEMAGSFNSACALMNLRGKSSQLQEEARMGWDRLLTPFGSRGAYGRNRQISSILVNDEISQQKATSVVLPSIFLMVAAFLVHVIASRLVSLQRTQIGTLKAAGYTNVEVLLHFVKLFLVLGGVGFFAGCVLGVALGSWMVGMYQDFFRFPSLRFELLPSALSLAGAAAFIPCIAGGWASLHSVYRLTPTVAMRSPDPPAYHSRNGMTGRFWNRLGMIDRMTARNLLHRPIRLCMVILGMCMAIAIVITTGFWTDTIEYVLTTQFRKANREDIDVALIRPIPQSGLVDLAALPGVIQVEGYRAVPARLRSLNREKDVVLMGWPSDGIIHPLRQVLSQDWEPIALPKVGVLLSRSIQDRWRLHPGDWVDVDLLEGQPRTLRLQVESFFEDWVGSTVSARIQNVWQWLAEEPVYSSVALRVDSEHMNETSIRLKGMSNVLGVNLKSAGESGFRKTVAKMIQTFTRMLTAFALVISLGVIYNSLRVSFSERSWELASLRVMGFESSAVFRLLAREVGIQVSLSILPGCLMGWLLAQLSLRTIHTERLTLPLIIENTTYASAVGFVWVTFLVSLAWMRRLMQRLTLIEALKSRE